MDIKDTRRAHLERHIGNYRTAEEFLSALNDRLQMTDEKAITSSYLSQLRIGPPAGRNIGDKVARRLEAGIGLEYGAFDRPIREAVSELDEAAAAISERWKRLPPERRAIVEQTLEALSQETPETH